jgi:K(+)-stimulated pyrophosphate-energized sodium pump
MRLMPLETQRLQQKKDLPSSAALTALALLASYKEEFAWECYVLRDRPCQFAMRNGGSCESEFSHFMDYYPVTLKNPKFYRGFRWIADAFLFCGLTMRCSWTCCSENGGRGSSSVSALKGILTGEGTPDYARCVAISTKGAQKEMLLPSILAILTPILTGILLGVSGVMGLLAGGLGSGFVLAVFMANSGGAWDNAKKYIEEGNLGGKGSDAHKLPLWEIRGDPFKDTAGPSLNILINL